MRTTSGRQVRISRTSRACSSGHAAGGAGPLPVGDNLLGPKTKARLPQGELPGAGTRRAADGYNRLVQPIDQRDVVARHDLQVAGPTTATSVR